MYSVRPLEAGRDFFSHSFREWNQTADLLTHQARQGQVYADFFYLSVLLLALAMRTLMGVCAAAEVPV
eukprot:2996367-Pyramimonas_sp.AAC.1